MKAAMIFDMDGTLFQTHRILEGALQDTFQSLRDEGVWTEEAPIVSYKEVMDVPLASVWKSLLPDHPINIQEKVNERFQSRLILNTLNGSGSLYPHTEELLSYLADRGFPIIVAGNGYTHYLQTIVKHYGLDRWITSVYSLQDIDSDDKGDLIREVKEDHDLTHGVVIGDRIQDFKGAEVNHFLSVGCAFDFSQEQELLEADIVVGDLMEIREYLEKVK